MTGKTASTARVAQRRARMARAGARRVEVTAPAQDAALIKAIASALRADDAKAEDLRQAIRPFVTLPPAQSGAELLAALRSGPLFDLDVDALRDRGPGRIVDLE